MRPEPCPGAVAEQHIAGDSRTRLGRTGLGEVGEFAEVEDKPRVVEKRMEVGNCVGWWMEKVMQHCCG